MRDKTSSLVANWAALMALSAALAFAANVGGAGRPGALWLGVIACIAALKSRIVLGAYLGLARAPAALAGFSSAVIGLLALVAASFMLFPTPARTAAPHARLAISSTFAGATE